ncbi:MAG: magnesium transporter [Candidatus Heimdallarchaeota archaeon]|nr:magnesium transporter [Candidatus Heimdallarchaeota archaeon]MCK4769721.1 magnesium transporter [Candidatus Heimdallarchaeota archaeon]
MATHRSPFSIFAVFTLTVLGGMIFNIGGLFAGRSAILLTNLQEILQWVFLIYPLLLTVRGDINGILSGKLGTALHLGTIEPKWRKNTNRFHQLISFIFIVTVFDAILVGFVASLLSFILGMSVNVIEILVVSITTFVFGAILSMVLTFSLTFFIYRRKGDPDVLVYPIMSSINDILITLIFFSVGFCYRIWKPELNLHLYIGIPIFLISVIVAVFLIIKWRKVKYITDGIIQSLPTLSITNLIAAGTGTVLASFQVLLGANPILLICYPAVISTVGSQGSVFANTTSTKLHLGTIKPSFSFFKSQDFLISFFGILSVGFLLNLIYSAIGTGITSETISFNFYLRLLLLLFATNLISFFLVFMISTAASFLTYRFGLDPDNLVNPILSSSADLITTSVLVLLSLPLFQ